MDSDATSAATGPQIRDALIKYLADLLRDLPGERRTFLHLPRVKVGLEWSQWIPEMEPLADSGRLQFRFFYVFYPAGDWDAERVCDRLSELWRMWGWRSSIDQGVPSGYQVTGKSPDAYELTLQARPKRGASVLHIVSPVFDEQPAAELVKMPFAVTPFGPLSLATAWATYPELITW